MTTFFSRFSSSLFFSATFKTEFVLHTYNGKSQVVDFHKCGSALDILEVSSEASMYLHYYAFRSKGLKTSALSNLF